MMIWGVDLIGKELSDSGLLSPGVGRRRGCGLLATSDQGGSCGALERPPQWGSGAFEWRGGSFLPLILLSWS